MTENIEWADPPPPVPRRRGMTPVWPDRMRALAANPNRWGRFGPYGSVNRSHMESVAMRLGLTIEVETRRDETSDRKPVFWLYIRVLDSN